MKEVVSELWNLVLDLIKAIFTGLGRAILVILSATLAGAVLGAGYGLIAGEEILVMLIIGGVIGFIVAVGFLILHALHGPW